MNIIVHEFVLTFETAFFPIIAATVVIIVIIVVIYRRIARTASRGRDSGSGRGVATVVGSSGVVRQGGGSNPKSCCHLLFKS